MTRGHVLPAAVALVLVTADPAAATSFVDSGYALHLRAAAVSADVGSAAPGAGVTVVDLDKEVGGVVGRCTVVGAGAYTDDLVGGFVRDEYPRHRPHDEEVLPVPPAERDTAPNLSPGESFSPRRPDPVRTLREPRRTVRDLGVRTDTGPGVRWKARCDSDSGGKAVASNGDLPGLGTAGSVTTAGVDRVPMRYAGVARAFVADVVTGAGTLDAVTSVVTVTSLPGREPTMTYRIGVTDGSVTSVLAAGTDVPLSALTAQFNRVATAADAYGLSLLGPTVTTAPDGTRTVHAPFLALRIGDVTTRLVAITFSGRR